MHPWSRPSDLGRTQVLGPCADDLESGTSGAMDPKDLRPLDRLTTALPLPKARRVLRRLWSGADIKSAEFAGGDRALSKAELRFLDEWIDRGLSSRVLTRTVAKDGTVRMVLGLCDGETIETVAMPSGTVCVSSQVGCAVACVFCASGLAGIKRNLDASEILEQVLWARREMPIGRVVFMGMGEPTQNLDHVLEAVRRIRDDAGISAGRQVVSTVGSIAAIERMEKSAVRPALAVSLHSVFDERRAELLTRAPREPIADLLKAADRYGRSVGLPVQLEWTLLEGRNDGDDEVVRGIELLRGLRACLNFIVYNAVDGLPFKRTSPERSAEIVAAFRAAGVYTTVRHSMGNDADAACGQLRRRHAEDLSAVVPKEKGSDVRSNPR